MIERNPRHASAQGRHDGFTVAAADLAVQRPLRSPVLRQIAASLQNNRLEIAGMELGNHLSVHPDDPSALHLAAQLENRRKRPAKASLLLARCLELAPDFVAARFDYSNVLLALHESAAALNEADRLLGEDAGNPLFLQLKAGILAAIGEAGEALLIWEQLTTRYPDRSESWRKYGDTLRALGFLERAVAAYRKAIECRTSFGLAWSSLANLQVFRFSEADIAAMEEQLQRTDVSAEDRIDILFALGKAFEDARAFEKSWGCYVKANAMRRIQSPEGAQLLASATAEKATMFTPAFLQRRSDAGFPASDPVFVVGRQRSGSTLVEQILSSHPAVEGTGELPYIALLAAQLMNREMAAGGMGYPQLLENLDLSEFRALGEAYLRRCQPHRKLGRPYFVDKSPNNYHHIGLIRLILPNAKIIDVRRNPAANCVAMFKFSHQGLPLRLNELGSAYRDYVELMAHFDRVQPGRIYRVIYEELVADPETEIRNLLDHLGLPFEESCLRFYQTERAVRTPSSAQVRRPISGESVEQWRNFEPWLAPLLAGLGTVLTEYPAVPEELRGVHQLDSLARGD